MKGRGETKKKRREREERWKYRKSSALQTRCCLVLTPFPWLSALACFGWKGYVERRPGPRVMWMELGPSRCMSRELDHFLYPLYNFFFFFFFNKGFLQSIPSHCMLLTITGNSNKPWFLANGSHPTRWMSMSWSVPPSLSGLLSLHCYYSSLYFSGAPPWHLKSVCHTGVSHYQFVPPALFHPCCHNYYNGSSPHSPHRGTAQGPHSATAKHRSITEPEPQPRSTSSPQHRSTSRLWSVLRRIWLLLCCYHVFFFFWSTGWSENPRFLEHPVVLVLSTNWAGFVMQTWQPYLWPRSAVPIISWYSGMQKFGNPLQNLWKCE